MYSCRCTSSFSCIFVTGHVYRYFSYKMC